MRQQTAARRTESTPFALLTPTHFCSMVKKGLVAQRLEQRTHNPLVPGSNPGGPTNFDVYAPTTFLLAGDCWNPPTKRVFVVILLCTHFSDELHVLRTTVGALPGSVTSL